MILVRDRLELVPYGTGVPTGLLPVLALMDGSRSLEALAAEATTLQGGRLVTADDVRGLVDELGQAGLLDTAAYRQAKADAEAAFCVAPKRQPVFAGQAYPAEASLLAAYLDGILDGVAPETPRPQGTPLAVIAPHIDPEAGRSAYAAAYAPLRGATPDRVVLLGVGHELLSGLYCLTDKTFATPLGDVPADTTAVARLRQAGGRCLHQGELPHRAEHSIEFQTVFLRHALGDSPFVATPILCGSAAGVLPAMSRQAFLDYAGPFLDALRELVRQPGTLIVAGVDFCHIGNKFGHVEPAEALEETAKAHDAALLAALAGGDADAFWAETARVDDRYNVCGLAALATLAEILPPAAMTLLCRDIMRDPATRSAVTFAAASFASR